jgi:hypothetical protein
MSCFEISSTHIDALLTAGLAYQRYGALRWLWPELSPEDQEAAYEQGEPWGPEAAKLTQQRRHELTRETAGRIGAMLMTENRLSVNHRYDENEIEAPYVFDSLPGQVDPVVVLKAIDCYEYQTCEHPEWHKSEAYAFCQALRDKMIHHLPGYDEADAWEISSRNVFQPHVDAQKTKQPVVRDVEPEPEEPAIDKYSGKSIRAALKAELGYNTRQVSVRLDHYSLGHSVYFTIRDPNVDYEAVKRFAEGRVESVSRCEYSGEILGGGNTYTHVEIADKVATAWAAPYVHAILKAERKSREASKGCGTALEGREGLWLFRDDHGYRVHVYDDKTQKRTFESGTEGPSLVRLATEIHLLLEKRDN